MLQGRDGRKWKLCEDLVEALTDVQAYLRGEIELESYEVDDALLHPRQTTAKRKANTLERN